MRRVGLGEAVIRRSPPRRNPLRPLRPTGVRSIEEYLQQTRDGRPTARFVGMAPDRACYLKGLKNDRRWSELRYFPRHIFHRADAAHLRRRKSHPEISRR